MRRLKAALVATLVLGGVLAVAAPAAGHDTAFAVDVDLEPEQPTAGDNTTVGVTLESLLEEGETTRVTDVTLYNGTGDDAEQLDSVDANEWVPGGESERFDLFAELDETGDRTLRVDLELISQEGDRTVVTREVPVTVVDPHPSMALSAAEVGRSGQTAMTLTLANGATVNATGVEVSLSSSDVTFTESRKVVSSLGPGESVELTTSASDVSAGPAEVTADVSYTTADGEHRSYQRSLSTVVESVDNPARISLSGVRIQQRGQTLIVRGSANNPGSTNATGTEIEAVRGEHVAPAPSRSTFFVGQVDASDFASFEVHSRLTTSMNGTVDVPVRIEYVVDGETVVRNTTLRHTVTSGGAAAQRQPQSGGLPIVPIAVVVVGALGIVGWRRYR